MSIWFHSSTNANSLMEAGGGDLFLTLFSRMPHMGSIMFKSGDWAARVDA